MKWVYGFFSVIDMATYLFGGHHTNDLVFASLFVILVHLEIIKDRL